MDETHPEYVAMSMHLLGCAMSQWALMYYLITLTPLLSLMLAPALALVLLLVIVYRGSQDARGYAAVYTHARHLIREFVYSTAGALFVVHTTGCSKQFRGSMDALIASAAAFDLSGMVAT